MIVRPQLAILRLRSMPKATPDLHLLDDAVAPRVLAAMRTASRVLTSLGVRHAVAGGLAVGAHGYPRNTRDAVVSAGTLVYLKLKSPRLKDRADVVELVKAGVDVEGVRKFLERDAPSLVAKLDECIARARAEEE